MRKLLLIIFIITIFPCVVAPATERAYAKTLSETIDEQLEHIDLNELESHLNNLDNDNNSFVDIIKKLLTGKIDFDLGTFSEYIKNNVISNFNSLLPSMFTVIAISLFCSIVQSSKSIFASEGISQLIFFVCFSSAVLVLFGEITNIIINSKKIIENIAKTSEIMSPIITTLLIASGGNSTASLYKPGVALFSNIVINVMLSIVFPLISLILIFGIISHFNKGVKLGKFVDLFNSVIKWIIGLSVTIFTIFISFQGIACSLYDGISVKAMKYAITNSIPLVGGLLKDGFDMVVAGSIILKNTIGVGCLIVLFFYVLTPVIKTAVFSVLLKMTAGVTDLISDSNISDFCVFTSKTLSLINAVVLLVAFMLFVSVFIMLISANAFV